MVDAPEDDKLLELLKMQSTKRWRTVKIKSMPFHLFVDLERFLEESNYIDFCIIFVKKFFWQKIYVHNLYTILEDYGKQKTELFEQYQWVFNPPQYGEMQQETIGTDLRKDFVKEFGSYVVLMDVVCKGDITKYKEVEKWTVEEFLFWANYLSGQKIIENVK